MPARTHHTFSFVTLALVAAGCSSLLGDFSRADDAGGGAGDGGHGGTSAGSMGTAGGPGAGRAGSAGVGQAGGGAAGRPSAGGMAGSGASGAGTSGGAGVAGASPGGPGCPANELAGLDPDAPWPMLGRCAGHRGQSAAKGPHGSSGRTAKSVVAATPGSFPVIGAGSVVYLGDANGTFAAYVAGAPMWTAHATATSAAPAIGAGGRIYVAGIDDGTIHALSTMTGNAVWELAPAQSKTPATPPNDGPCQLAFAGLSSPAPAADGSVWVSFNGDWTCPNGTPMLSDNFGVDSLLAVDSVGVVSSDVGTGATYSPVGDASRAPAIGPDGTIYAATSASEVVAIRHGSSLWRSGIGATTMIALSPSADRVYFGNGADLIALDSLTGKTAWKASPEAGVVGALAVADDGTVYATSARSLAAVDAKGKKKWSLPMEDAIVGPPVIGADGIVYFAAGPSIVGIAPGGATPVWTGTISNGQATTAPAIDSDGTIYVGTLQALDAFPP